MRSLVLDQATIKTGFAVVDDDVDQFLNYGVRGRLIEHGRIMAPASMPVIDRMTTLRTDILHLIQKFKVQELVAEDTRYVRQPSAATNQAMASALVMVQDAARQSGLPLYYQAPSHIKSVFTGYGNADKEQIIEAVTCIWRIPRAKIKDDNHADALAAAYVWLYEGNEVRARQAQKRKGRR